MPVSIAFPLPTILTFNLWGPAGNSSMLHLIDVDVDDVTVHVLVPSVQKKVCSHEKQWFRSCKGRL